MQTDHSIQTGGGRQQQAPPEVQGADENKQSHDSDKLGVDQEDFDDFEMVAAQPEQNPIRMVLMDPRVQHAYRMVKDQVITPMNERLIETGTMKKFIAQEALELRYCLQVLCLYHVFNVVFTNVSPFMKLVDLAFLYLTGQASLKLSKLYIVGYALSAVIIIFIGLSHLPYLKNFRSIFAYLYFMSELVVLMVGTLVVANLLHAHVLMQEVIRISNENRKNRYNINKQIEKQFKPRVIGQVKKKIEDVIYTDPDEETYFAIKEAQRQAQEESDEEEAPQQTALDVTYKITKSTVLLPIKGTYKVGKFVAGQFKRSPKVKKTPEQIAEQKAKMRQIREQETRKYSSFAPMPNTPQPKQLALKAPSDVNYEQTSQQWSQTAREDQLLSENQVGMGGYDIIVQSVEQEQQQQKEGKRGIQTFEMAFSDDDNNGQDMDFTKGGSDRQIMKTEPLVPDFENSAGSFDNIQGPEEDYDIYKIFNIDNQQDFNKLKQDQLILLKKAQQKKNKKKRILW